MNRRTLVTNFFRRVFKIRFAATYCNCIVLLLIGFWLSTTIKVVAAPADLDRTFGSNGRALTPIDNRPAQISASVIQQDGKIVAVGVNNPEGFSTPSDIIVARYNPNGSLDTSFGNGGIVRTNTRGGYDSARDVVLQPDGKIIVVGISRAPGSGGGADFAVLRYNTNGSLDTSFGNGGIVLTEVRLSVNVAETVALQPDGKILVAGLTSIGEGSEVAIVRYLPNGSLDTSFDGDGKITDIVDGEAYANDIVIQPDGKIVIAGYTFNGIQGPGILPSDILLIRYNSNGSLDTNFGNSGKVKTDVGNNAEEIATTLALQPDGKIVVGGTAWTPEGNFFNEDFAILRYNPNGSLDSSFGASGKVVMAIGDRQDNVESLSLQPNGRIIVTGRIKSSNTLDYGAVVRLLTSGSLDSTFGTNGKTLIQEPNTKNQPFDIFIQPNGRIVVAGEHQNITERGFGIWRLLGRNTLADYDSDGRADITVFRPATGTWFRLNSTNNQFVGAQLGLSEDIPLRGDFDGDGHSDLAVFRPSTGTWFYQTSGNNQFHAIQFGLNGDVPVPADFDGDGKDDIAVFRPSDGVWYRINSSNGQVVIMQFGLTGDKPAIGDFDGDGLSDIAVFRPSPGVWFVQGSKNGFFATQFGQSGDIPVAGDYDGDQITDIAVFRPLEGVWYVRKSSSGFTGLQWGVSSDKPTPGDFDGDGRTDVAVYRDGTWYILQSTAGFAAVQFGLDTDIPILKAN